MASPIRSVRVWRVFTPAALLALLLVAPAHALRVVCYNVTNYPSVLFPARQPHFRTVLGPLGADVVVCQEFRTQAGVDSFRINVLNVLEPGQWSSAPFTDGPDTDNAFFYKPSRVGFLGQRAFYVSSDAERYVNEYRIQPVGYVSSAAELRIFSVHLKASTGSTNVAQRLREATGLRDTMNAMPAGTHAFVCGDFNIYSGAEGAFLKFKEDQSDDDGRLYDPLNLPAITWNTASMAPYHTQCPCITCPSGSGFSGGGLDDRFDMFLPTLNLGGSDPLAVIPGSYIPVGNDGLHYNLNINAAPVIPEGQAYADALWNASDHLPIRIDLRLPARLSTDPALAFGSVIVGAPTQSRDLAVSNPAVAPADSLNCTFSAPGGFGAPGPLAVAAGASAPATITMSPGEVGGVSGILGIYSDAPDSPTTLVGLSGTVLDHAQASLDSVADVAERTLDFGEHAVGAFTPRLAALHNRGYDGLRARLAVSAAQITGGDGRFSIAGFGPALLAGTAGRWSVQFDATGAAGGSTHEAVLTFTSADEPLPGATPQPDVRYLLVARVTGVFTDVEPGLPTVTRLHPPMPNPLVSGSTLRFDLAGATSARLEVFDLSGRRVAVLADRDFTPGRYSLRWDGRGGSGGALGPGLYFVRLATRGLAPQTVRLAVVR